MALSPCYPVTQANRQQLADELTALGYIPTQAKHHFYRDKINAMIDAMRDGSFDWNKASLRHVFLGPNGEIVSGHHRVIAAHLAGIDLTAIPGASLAFELPTDICLDRCPSRRSLIEVRR